MLRSLHLLVAVLAGCLLASAATLDNVGDLREQRAGLRDSLNSIAVGWGAAADEYFQTPVATAALLRSGMGTGSEITPLDLIAAVRLDDDIDAAFVGWPDGRFLFGARSDSGGFRTRVRAPSGASEWRWTNDQLRELESRSEPADGFDPRNRPWYRPIEQGATSAWSMPYRFASSGNLGITHSVPVTNERNELLAVVGIDVRLSSVTDFLVDVKPGVGGVALLLASDRSLVASSAEGELDSGITADQIAQRIEIPNEPGSILQSSVTDQYTAASRRVGPGGDWVLAVVADEVDFVTAERRPVALVLRWLVIALLAAGLAYAALRPLLRRFDALYIDATRDDLTGLANRAAITADLGRLLAREQHRCMVAIVDLDRFKPINDTWGHHEGDRALAEIADRLAHFSAQFGFRAGRLGGDEFLLIGEHDSIDEADDAWPALLVEMRRPVRIGDADVSIGASIGVTQVLGGDTRSVEATLRRADRALYTVKRNGGDGWMRDDRLDLNPDETLPVAPSIERRSGSRRNHEGQRPNAT